jgi:ABC-type iron transport system FetAB ATPase subunit
MKYKISIKRHSEFPREIHVEGFDRRLIVDFGRNVGYNEEVLVRSILNMGERNRAAKIRDAQKVVEELTNATD